LILNKKKAIIWDWNGTLLDDIDVCLSCINSLLRDRKKQVLNKIRYRDIFEFPVKDYYLKAGFDFTNEPFEKPAMQFIDLYYSHLSEANLFPEVEKVLLSFKKLGFHQSVLSAMENQNLIMSLKEKGVEHYFECIAGIEDHFAESKVEIGKELIDKIPFSVEEIVLIGDTLHDLDVSNTLGIDCVLITNGHQSKSRLLEKSENVVDSLNDVSEFIISK